MGERMIDLTSDLPTLSPEDYSVFSGLLAISVNTEHSDLFHNTKLILGIYRALLRLDRLEEERK